MNYLNKYINDKIEITEEIINRDLSGAEKNDIRESLANTLIDFADKYGFDDKLIFEDINIIATLDELIECSEEEALEYLKEVL